MARLLQWDELPRHRSTRDTRDRVDLIKPETIETDRFRADHVLYHPGDTSAKHSHPDAAQIFYVLRGEGKLFTSVDEYDLEPGDLVWLPEAELHWFENPTPEFFSFIEFWVPAPRAPTDWLTDDC